LEDPELSILPCLHGKKAHTFGSSITFTVRKDHVHIIPETLIEEA